VIAHNTEQQCGFGFALPPEESHITPSLETTALGYGARVWARYSAKAK